MLLVNGNLTVSGKGNAAIAGKNLPALYITGDLIIESGANLEIEGLAVVDGRVFVNGDAVLNVLGGLFAYRGLFDTTVDSLGYKVVLYNGTARSSPGYFDKALSFDGLNDTAEDAAAGSYFNNLSAMTFSVWVKSNVVNQDIDIMYTRTPNGADDGLGLRYDHDGAFGGGVRGIRHQ